jgi:hypothetical protein
MGVDQLGKRMGKHYLARSRHPASGSDPQLIHRTTRIRSRYDLHSGLLGTEFKGKIGDLPGTGTGGDFG